MAGLEELVTESGRADADYAARSTRELVELVNREDATVAAAVAAVAVELAATIDAIVERLKAGGRLVYVGAGSSGRIAALDADESEATFSTAPGQVVALVAGAGLASAQEREAAEDDAEAGVRALDELQVSERDAVVGVSASGRTPYTVAALERAAAAGALTVALVAAPGTDLAAAADHRVGHPRAEGRDLGRAHLGAVLRRRLHGRARDEAARDERHHLAGLGRERRLALGRVERGEPPGRARAHVDQPAAARETGRDVIDRGGDLRPRCVHRGRHACVLPVHQLDQFRR